MPPIEPPAARGTTRLAPGVACLRGCSAMVCGALIALSAACGGGQPAAAPAVSRGDDVRDDLTILRTTRILFAHQSVGTNLLDGVDQLGRAHGAPVDVQEIAPDTGTPPAGFAHVLVGQNGSPRSKLVMFPWVLRGFSDTPFDLAILKFCYLDFTAGTDVPRVFASYQDLVSGLRQRHPRTVFVHVTAPLRADDGTRGRINAWLGRWDARADNDKRNDFNALLRTTYSSDPLFDLAAVESTLPDGRRSTYACGRGTCEALAPEYTTDGGHLNALGSRVAASELVRVLAGARRQQLAATPAAASTLAGSAPLDD